MPIDVGSGTVHKEYVDISVGGKYGLTWPRNYRSSNAARQRSPLGHGWTNQYFCKLVFRAGVYYFLDPMGAVVSFPDPQGRIEAGELIVDFSSFHDLRLMKDRYVLRHWEVDSGEITHFIFQRASPGAHCPLRALEDCEGQGLDLEFSADQRLVAVRQRLEQRELRLEYDAAGWISAVTLRAPDGEAIERVRYDHDDAGQLVAAADAAGLQDRYEYADGQMTREIVKDGGVFTLRYDSEGRCVFSSGLNHYDEKRLRYFDAARYVEVTDSVGSVWRYKYLATAQITDEVNPLGAVKHTEYDDHGRIIEIVDATGSKTLFSYDAWGNRASVTNAAGDSYVLEYDAARLPVRMTDPKGGVWEHTYDARNRLVRSCDPMGSAWGYSYDHAGNLVEVRNPLGARTELRFSRGELAEGTDWKGNASCYRFDSAGRLIERIDPLKHVTHIGYDVWGNIAEHRSPDGSIRRMQYDATGNLTEYADPSGAVMRFVYGPCSLLQKMVLADGSELEFLWTTEPDQLSEIRNEDGESYRFIRDAAGNVIEEIGFDGRHIRREYDPADREIALVTGADERIVFKRDILGRVICRRLPDGSQEFFSFDSLGDLATARNDHISLTFERDPLGRLLREVQGSHWVASDYNEAGQLIRLSTDLGLEVQYELDANGDAQRISCGGTTALMERNACGTEVVRTYSGTMRVENARDPLGRLVGQRASPLGSGVGLRRQYHYNANGQLEQLSDDQWGDCRYAYDVLDQLTRASSSGGLEERFEYTKTGNIGAIDSVVEGTAAYSSGNRLERLGTTRYRYDRQGRLLEQGTLADGQLVSVTTYEWTAADDLAGIATPDGDRWSYTYDPLGRRIGKFRNGAPHTQFVWNRDALAHEIRGESRVGWLCEAENLAPIFRTDEHGVSAALCDHLGTPVAFVNRQHTIHRADRLSAWGVVISQSQAPFESNIRFQGQYHDRESDLHYSRFRYYLPAMGRFISPDPLGWGGGLNLYRYTNDPINLIDPYGLSTSTDSQQLGQNLRDSGSEPQGDDEDAHHLVMSNSKNPQMKQLRTYMSDNGIDINDERNGIWLPRTQSDRARGDSRTTHKGEGLHGDSYKKYVYDKLMAGSPPPPSKRTFLARLKQLKQELAKGKTFACKR